MKINLGYVLAASAFMFAVFLLGFGTWCDSVGLTCLSTVGLALGSIFFGMGKMEEECNTLENRLEREIFLRKRMFTSSDFPQHNYKNEKRNNRNLYE